MKRKDFLKCCTIGLCSCAAQEISLLDASQAQSAGTKPPGDPEKDELKWKLNAVQERFARLLNILDQTLDPPAKQKVLRALGRECAGSYRDLALKYEGNIKGFLEYIQKRWVEKAEYDEKAGTIRIVDKASQCTCPFVKQGVTHKDFCNCTLGWQEAIYSVVLRRPVRAEVEESVLRGGSRCIFRIRILKSEA